MATHENAKHKLNFPAKEFYVKLRCGIWLSRKERADNRAALLPGVASYICLSGNKTSCFSLISLS